MAGCCENNNEPYGCIKRREYYNLVNVSFPNDSILRNYLDREINFAPVFIHLGIMSLFYELPNTGLSCVTGTKQNPQHLKGNPPIPREFTSDLATFKVCRHEQGLFKQTTFIRLLEKLPTTTEPGTSQTNPCLVINPFCAEISIRNTLLCFIRPGYAINNFTAISLTP
jgi:hypothetical protein